MKTLNNQVLKAVNYILAGILALLGFSGCSKDDGSDLVSMYGSPHTTFNLYGKILNASDKGIPDIKIEFKTKMGHDEKGNAVFLPCNSAVITDQYGNFSSSYSYLPTDVIRIVATDIDGEANGSFANDSIDIKISDNEYVGGDGDWNWGTVSKENITIALKEREREKNE